MKVKEITPTIVIPTFNRPKSLLRLLKSLNIALYPNQSVRLIISIDYENTNAQRQVTALAKKFIWKHGEKLIIQHTKNVGLKDHLLSCGDLTEKYDSIVMLEEDLLVAPNFYNFISQSIQYYKSYENIAGISLYSYEICESLNLPFQPILDNSDVYFMQIPSSWGQGFHYTQWQTFKNWLENNNEQLISNTLYNYANKWNPENSWKRSFMAYLIDTNRYFIFPRQSMSTNFNDPGTNINRTDNNHKFQVNLLLVSKHFKFKPLSKSISIYDSFFEPSSWALKKLHPPLKPFDFEVDLRGGKKLSEINMPYLLTSKDGVNPILSFSNQMRPLESNIIFNIYGNSIHLFKTGDIKENDFMNRKYKYKTLKYLDYHLHGTHDIEYSLAKSIHPKYLWEALRNKISDKLTKLTLHYRNPFN